MCRTRRGGKKWTGGGVMACHAKAARSMNIPWEFTLNCFWFVYFFQYSALAHTPSVPVLTPRAPPPPPAPLHATLSSPSPTLSQVVLRCPSNAAMKDHYKLLEPVNKSTLPLCPPCSPLVEPAGDLWCEGGDEFLTRHFQGAPIELPVANANGLRKRLQRKRIVCCLPLGVDG